jgi:hypothetical protein
MSRPAEEQGTPCRRFEEEGLLRLEQGLPLDEHFDTCPACVAARARHAQLFEGLSTLGQAYTGRGDWQARVWAGVARRQQSRRSLRAWWLALPAAAAALALFLVLRPGAQPAGPALAYAIIPGGASAPMRGDHAKPGDALEVRIQTGGAAHAELRVYRDDDTLIVRCSDAPPCSLRDGALTARVVLEERGRYQIAFVHGAQPIPAPAPQLDQDLAQARAAGATVDLRSLDVL